MPRGQFQFHRIREAGHYVLANRHIASAGTAPSLAVQPGDIVTEFVNEHGEQWVAHLRAAERDAHVRGGDIGWDEPAQPRVYAKGSKTLLLLIGEKSGPLILNPGENQWLSWWVHEFAGKVFDLESLEPRWKRDFDAFLNM